MCDLPQTEGKKITFAMLSEPIEFTVWAKQLQQDEKQSEVKLNMRPP